MTPLGLRLCKELVYVSTCIGFQGADFKARQQEGATLGSTKAFEPALHGFWSATTQYAAFRSANRKHYLDVAASCSVQPAMMFLKCGRGREMAVDGGINAREE